VDNKAVDDSVAAAEDGAADEEKGMNIAGEDKWVACEEDDGTTADDEDETETASGTGRD